MPTYETVFITLPSLTDQEESDLVGSLAQVVTDDGGELVANDRMGRRRLAYPVRKFEDGVYTRFLYDSTPAAPRELDRRIRLSDKILRHLTVRLELDWAVAAKEQAVRDEQERREAEIRAAEEAKAAEEKQAIEAASAPPDSAEASQEPPAARETAAAEDANVPEGDSSSEVGSDDESEGRGRSE